MSLFGSIRMANNTLHAQQVGLQVVGQNISNVNTPGYIREEVQFETAPVQKKGDLVLGLGVSVTGVVQKVDAFLQERMRTASSEAANSATQEETFVQLESLIAELGDTDLSTSMNDFFSSINDVLNQPESSAIRDLAVLQGEKLTSEIGRLNDRLLASRGEINDRIIGAADDINRLTGEIFELNRRVSLIEAGDHSGSDAVGIRDQRNTALDELAQLVDIQVNDQPSGAVTISIGGDSLVTEAFRREVTTFSENDRGYPITEIRFVDTDAPPNLTTGRIAGLIESRDEILGGFLSDLDAMAGALAFEFNKVHSSGQGLVGHQFLEGEFSVNSTSDPLDETGLAFTPENGSFQVLVRNRDTDVTKTTDIRVDLNGLDNDSSLDDIVAALDAVDGISVSTTSDRRISIQSETSDIDFSFANDTSGLLASLGVNTFFSGSTAATIGVRDELQADSRLLATSTGGIGEDTNNAVLLAGFLDQPLDTVNGDSLDEYYKRITGNVTQATAVARAVADGDQVFYGSLEAQHFATSGVNLDDEIVRMISYQRAYQAAARYISELNDLMQVLINI